MAVVLVLLREALRHAERQVAGLSEGVLRAALFAAMIALACLNPTIFAILMWAAVLRYVPMALRSGAEEDLLRDAHRFAAEAASRAQADLKVARERIKRLERDLAVARQAAERGGSAKIDPIFYAVGLHEGAPDFLIESARRAYRLRLHPDRHPAAHKMKAHEQFVAAEAKFEVIYARRGMRG
ncbi:hypothetical protein [Methylobacterium nigriterrae]|uniref:hypothetical protein n=1 Tax=Methylobacterium nigriterrae TaxID=3127512 RepID=UPI00301354E5